MDPTQPAMPMGSAARLPITAADLMPPMRAPAPPAAATPPAAAGMMAGPGGTPLGTPASPGAPQEMPYNIRMQPDGSAIWESKTSPPVVIGVVPAPKLPQSLQPKRI